MAGTRRLKEGTLPEQNWSRSRAYRLLSHYNDHRTPALIATVSSSGSSAYAASLEASRESDQKSTKGRLTNKLRRLIQPFLLMRSPRVTLIRAILALLSTFFAVSATGQLGTSTLRGKVSDTRGHAVGGAQVLLYIGAHRDVRASSVSGRFGQFEFAHIAPASDYRLRVACPGYVRIEAAGISQGKRRASGNRLQARCGRIRTGRSDR